MIRRSLILSLLCVFLLIAGLIFDLGWVQESDSLQFQSLLDRGVEIKNQSKAHHAPVDQLRENIQKDIWYMEDGYRKQDRKSVV